MILRPLYCIDCFQNDCSLKSRDPLGLKSKDTCVCWLQSQLIVKRYFVNIGSVPRVPWLATWNCCLHLPEQGKLLVRGQQLVKDFIKNNLLRRSPTNVCKALLPLLQHRNLFCFKTWKLGLLLALLTNFYHFWDASLVRNNQNVKWLSDWDIRKWNHLVFCLQKQELNSYHAKNM